jgi:hypothetical protein
MNHNDILSFQSASTNTFICNVHGLSSAKDAESSRSKRVVLLSAWLRLDILTITICVYELQWQQTAPTVSLKVNLTALSETLDY